MGERSLINSKFGQFVKAELAGGTAVVNSEVIIGVEASAGLGLEFSG